MKSESSSYPHSSPRWAYFLSKSMRWGEIREAKGFVPIRETELAILSSIQSDFRDLKTLTQTLNNLLKDLKDRPVVYSTKIYDLGIENFKLKIPADIVIERYEDEFVAKIPDLEIFGSGETEPEAILDLKKEIVELYKDLMSFEGKLGSQPQTWLRILKGIIKTR